MGSLTWMIQIQIMLKSRFLSCTLFFFILQYSILCQETITVGNTTLTEREVAIGIQVPWEMLYGPDKHLWVTERRGKVLRIEPETGNTVTILDIQDKVEASSEPGLLGMCLHPDFENEPLVYLVYTYAQGFQLKERLVSYEWDGESLIDEVILLDELNAAGIHNGSRIIISSDDKIFMTTGDVGSANLSQNMNSLSGKLLRINLDGSIPNDNPNPDSYIYSYGHRNAQGLAYGPNGQLYSSEHGAQQYDEVNLIEENRNYGWPNVEGECNTNLEISFCDQFNVKEPLLQFAPCIAINDIHYYNHESFPEWSGKMLMAVLGGLGFNSPSPGLIVMTFNEDGTDITDNTTYFTDYGRLRDVCSNPVNGAIYIATNGPGYPSSGPNRIIEYRNLNYNPNVSTKEFNEADQFIKITPNYLKTGQDINIEFSESFKNSKFELYRMDGKKIMEGTVHSSIETIRNNTLTSGNYYLRAESRRGVITKKIVVQ